MRLLCSRSKPGDADAVAALDHSPVVVVVGAGIGIYMLTPVRGPERDLTLVGDATRGAYLIRLGGCVTCHTDRKAPDAMLAGRRVGLPTPFGTFYPPNITPSEDRGDRQLDARAVLECDEQWRGTGWPPLSGVPL